MMQFLSRMAVFATLALETPAPIECAWVLWLSSEAAYTPLDSFKTREQCAAGIEVAQAMAKVKAGRATVLCLPDTVDPRRPRSK